MDVSKYVITSEQLLCKYAPLIGNADDHLWGGYIRRGAVTAIIGETSAGKTTLLHNLVYKLSQGEEFLNIAPPKALKVFYCDYESYNAVLAEHLMSIGVADQWHFLNKEAGDVVPRGTMLTTLIAQLLAQTSYDLIVVDPLMDADPVDENDNTAASMQVSRWRDVAHKFNCGVILVHNTGKGSDRMDEKELAATAMYRARMKHTGRGASSRTDRYDIQLNYVKVDKTTRILCVAKTRSGNMNDHWVLKFAEGDLGFVVSDFNFNVSHVSPPIENETVRQLNTLIQAHPDESLSAIYRNYVKGVMPLSRATFFRHAAGSRLTELPTSGGSGATEAAPSHDVSQVETPVLEGTGHLPALPHPSGGTGGQMLAHQDQVERWRAPYPVQASFGLYLDRREALEA